MKVWPIAIASLLVGIAAGVAASWAEYRWKEAPLPDVVETSGDESGQAGTAEGQPKVVVLNDATYDFGVMGRDVGGERAFVLKNEGDSPLDVDYDRASCGLCIKTTFQHARVAPGQTVEIPIHWVTQKKDADFEEYAEFYTNDPEREYVRLTIRGFVPPSLRVDPDKIFLGDISASEPMTRRVRIYAYETDDLKIVDATLINSDSADWFDVRIEPASAEDLAEDPRARSAAVAVVTAGPGLPLGEINQTVRLTSNLTKDAVVEFSVEGRVVGDISILGQGNFDAGNNLLHLGLVDRAVGAEVKLYLLVKGPHRDDVRFEVERTEPEKSLQAAVGQRRDIRDGAVIMYPLTIEVPKNSRPVNYLGARTEENGKVILSITHSDARQLVIYVRFGVEN